MMNQRTLSDEPRTIVIGGGQAGLAVGYHLARRGIAFTILDANNRVGDSWRTRWDSLRLFTPAAYDGLPGLPFPAPKHYFPTKDEMADYLEEYVRQFDLPVRSGIRVMRLTRAGDNFLLETSSGEMHAENVIVAMSNYQCPRTPVFAQALSPNTRQLHSADYRNPGQLAPGAVLVVGAGNSGAEIARELASDHEIFLAGNPPGEVPFRIESALAKNLFIPLVLRLLFHRVLTVDTPVGRRAQSKHQDGGTPLLRVRTRDLEKAGVHRLPRVVGVRDGKPVLERGDVLDVQNVIWCTGFDPGFSWIDIPEVKTDGMPEHHKGVAEDAPGLFFVGLDFLFAASSAMVQGVGRDGERIARHIALRSKAPATVSA
jgi:putative flavoprotein involved in K+ transport